MLVNNHRQSLSFSSFLFSFNYGQHFLLLQGYRSREIFIATQAPMKESVEDFWRMIWEYECYVIVMLLNEEEDEEVWS